MKSKTIRVLKYIHRADVPTRAAAVSYYAMLASIPLLAIILTFSAQLLPNLDSPTAVGMGHVTTTQLNDALARILPVEANDIIKREIMRIQSEPPVGLLSVGLILTLWTASNAYMALLTAMNQIYGVVESRPYWQVRGTAIVMPILFSVLLIVALTSIVVAPAVINFFELSHFAGSLMQLAQFGVLFFIVLATFEASYRLGPPSKIGRRGLVSVGSVVGASIFLVSSLIFQTYVQSFGSYDRVYGSIGGFIVFLVWLWMSSACLLLGCAVNKALEEEALAPLRNVRELVRTLD